tara:strand:- start:303 stop:569 length:267 start_codon:yes stop_codon:yes gene_type:complete
MGMVGVKFVYILRIDAATFYTGITQNLRERVNQHLSRQSKSTRKYKELKLVYYEKFASYGEARSKEVYIKNRGAKRFLCSIDSSSSWQ